MSQAGCQEPLRWEQERGPQHKVKPLASTNLQFGSQAAHFTAMATSARQKSRVESRAGSFGVGGAASVQGGIRNSGDPSRQPKQHSQKLGCPSRQELPYKPKVKAGIVERESEGITVLKNEGRPSRTKAVRHNAAGGKGPCGESVRSGGKRKGMTGRSGSNTPDGRKPADKVRQLQRVLWFTAKRQPGRRFHALYDRIYRSDVLWEAWKRVRKNKGAAGVDAQTLGDIEQYGVEQLIEELQAELRQGEYRPKAVLRRYIPKSDGKKRPLGIPAVRDRIVQMATKLMLEPIFEADFMPCSYGFRPKRSCVKALEMLRKQASQSGNHVLDADIRDYFGSIDHDKLMKLVGRRISDRRVLKLLRQWLTAGVMEEDGRLTESLCGTPQGGVISPLLSNIYLSVLDSVWTKKYAHLGTLVRYADDFVVMCRTKAACERAEEVVRNILARLGLELHPDKTRKVDLSWGKQGFDFLGCHLRKRLSGRLWARERRRLYFLQRWPSHRSMKRIRGRVKELTGRNRNGVKDVRVLIDDLNPVLRGWGNYYRTGNGAIKFCQVDSYVWRRLHRFMVKRKGRHLRAGVAETWSNEFFHQLGLHRLGGTIHYPEGA